MEDTIVICLVPGEKPVGIPNDDSSACNLAEKCMTEGEVDDFDTAFRLFAMINPHRDSVRSAGSFGSHGRSDKNGKTWETNLKALKYKYLDKDIIVKFSSSEVEFKTAYDSGVAFGKQLQCA